MNMNKFVLFGLILISLSVVNAFGVATPYWDENPLKLAPGESMDVKLNLQNMAGKAGDATLRAKMINSGGGIASLTDSNLDYFVPFGSDDVIVNVKVFVPASVVKGGTREVVISFTQISNEKGGMVSVSGGFTTKFPVFVVTPEESALFVPKTEIESPAKSYVWVWVAGLIVGLTVIWFGWRKWNRRK